MPEDDLDQAETTASAEGLDRLTRRASGRRRPKADAAPADAATLTGELAEAGQGGREHVRVLEALLEEDMGAWHARSGQLAETRSTSRSQIVDDSATALLARAWALSWALWRRGATPVFLTGAARLVSDVPADFGEALGALMRRRNQPQASDLWTTAAGWNLHPYDTLKVLAHYTDAACDDLAGLGGIERAQLLELLWGEDYDPS